MRVVCKFLVGSMMLKLEWGIFVVSGFLDAAMEMQCMYDPKCKYFIDA